MGAPAMMRTFIVRLKVSAEETYTTVARDSSDAIRLALDALELDLGEVFASAEEVQELPEIRPS